MISRSFRSSDPMPIRYFRGFAAGVLLSTLVSILPANPAIAQLTPEVLDAVKQATVLIECGEGENRSSGSGFVVWADNTHALIATNYHVVADAIEPPGKLQSSPGQSQLKCIHEPGNRNEQVVFATVHAYSAADDLALLAVMNLRPSTVLPPSRDFVPLETQRVYVAGFPFGEVLGIGGRRPNVTISEAISYDSSSMVIRANSIRPRKSSPVRL